MSNQTHFPPLGAIFGSGRSGTTWLGCILSSHPDVAYRFEPFHRSRSISSSNLNTIKNNIEQGNFSEEELWKLYQELKLAYSAWEKPPFFSKNHQSYRQKLRPFLYPLARKFNRFDQFYSSFFKPSSEPLLIFKEVTMTNLFVNLLKTKQVPLVYIIRHPCAVLSSLKKGQEKKLMAEGRRTVLKSLLAKHDPQLAESYKNQIDNNSLSILEQEALLWRVDNEKVLKSVHNQPNALLIWYEELTQNSLELSETLMSHFNLKMTKEVVRFLEESTQEKFSRLYRIQRGELGIDPYFSIFRNPQVSRDKWKETMSQEEKDEVLNIVQDSIVFLKGCELGGWD